MNEVNSWIKGEFTTVQNEYTAFQAEVKEKEDKLEAAADLLKTDDTLNPIAIIEPPVQKMIPIESPEAFYTRTIHTGNIGVISLDVIRNYSDIMLKLPQPDYF
jgi:hypothetical protein